MPANIQTNGVDLDDYFIDINAIYGPNDNGLWTFGYNDYGQLGVGDITNRSSPVQVGTLTNWSEIASGGYHTVATRAF